MPANAVIDSAFLSLYADTMASNGFAGQPTYGSNNAAGIYQVTGSWTGSISWNMQPTHTSTDSVLLPQSTATKENYTHVNVTGMVQNMVSSHNYGFLIKLLQETTPYNSMLFYSPNGTVAGKQPVQVPSR